MHIILPAVTPTKWGPCRAICIVSVATLTHQPQIAPSENSTNPRTGIISYSETTSLNTWGSTEKYISQLPEIHYSKPWADLSVFNVKLLDLPHHGELQGREEGAARDVLACRQCLFSQPVADSQNPRGRPVNLNKCSIKQEMDSTLLQLQPVLNTVQMYKKRKTDLNQKKEIHN